MWVYEYPSGHGVTWLSYDSLEELLDANFHGEATEEIKIAVLEDGIYDDPEGSFQIYEV